MQIIEYRVYIVTPFTAKLRCWPYSRYMNFLLIIVDIDCDCLRQMDKVSRTTKYRQLKRRLEAIVDETSAMGTSVSQHPNDTATGTENAEDAEDVFYDSLDDTSGEEFFSGENVDSDDGSNSGDRRDSDDNSENNPDGLENESGSLRFKLAQWANTYSISHSALLSLLTILSLQASLDLPKDPRTLLQTNTQVTKQVAIGQGDYHFFGLQRSILKILKRLPTLPSTNTLYLQLNIDGLPLFKSSSLCVWPILGLLKDVSNKVFPIALFCGQGKPPLNDYVKDFVKEYLQLAQTGIIFGGQKFTLALHSLVCDAPARAFLKCIKGHAGYNGCERCEQEGSYVAGRMTFPEADARERSRDRFNDMTDESHHHRESPLAALSFDMVKQVPLDYMHLCCLGVMRLMVRLWMCGPLITRLPASAAGAVSEKLIKLRRNIPREFARKPRSLYEFRLWKATEYRLFMLYTGMIALKGAVPPKMYQLFLQFSSAMTILLDPVLAREHASYAQALLKNFVKNFAIIFGSQFIVYNVHSLVHLADDARTYGALDTVSCFPFENYLQRLKKHVRRPTNPLSQIIRRISEQDQVAKHEVHCEKQVRFKREHRNGPLPLHCTHVERQFKQMHGNVFLSASDGDNCILFNDQDEKVVAVIRNFIKTSDGMQVIVQRFEEKVCFYSYPFESSRLGIFKVSTFSANLESFATHRLHNARKCILSPLNETSFVSVPLLHMHCAAANE